MPRASSVREELNRRSDHQFGIGGTVTLASWRFGGSSFSTELAARVRVDRVGKPLAEESRLRFDAADPGAESGIGREVEPGLLRMRGISVNRHIRDGVALAPHERAAP